MIDSLRTLANIAKRVRQILGALTAMAFTTLILSALYFWIIGELATSDVLSIIAPACPR